MTDIPSLPRHVDPIKPDTIPRGRGRNIYSVTVNRHALAPYNFVELPDQIVTAEEPPHLNAYDPNLFTGTIHCTLRTETPLYTRTALALPDFIERGDRPYHRLNDLKRRYGQGFTHADPVEVAGQPMDAANPADTRLLPVIPGSSLRGLVRTLVEIAGYGKIERVSDRHLYFRSARDDYYSQHFVQDCGNQHYATKTGAGRLRRGSGGAVIEECEVARVAHADIMALKTGEAVHVAPPGAGGAAQNLVPNPVFQHLTVWVTVDPPTWHPQYGGPTLLYARVTAMQATPPSPPDPGFVEGTLVIAGPMNGKTMEFVFLKPATPKTLSVEPWQVEEFEGEQVTPWQEDAFPATGARRKMGGLYDGEPVFFLTEATSSSQVRFFGRAQLFRLPYRHTIHGFIPERLRRSTDTDLADALFGPILSGGQAGADRANRAAFAGRVSVGHARFTAPTAQGHVWATTDPIVPRILGGPKPSTFQQYLTQSHAVHPRRRGLARQEPNHYDVSPDQATIRGHKLYWHRNQAVSLQNQADHVPPSQQTALRPVAAGVTFSFAIHVEQLREHELGALLWVLRHASGDYRLKLGMGKPHGFGSVEITVDRVVRRDRATRYATLFAGNGWATGDEPALDQQARHRKIDAFTQYVHERIPREAETLEEEPRIRNLLAMLKFPGPGIRETRYLEIEREVTRQRPFDFVWPDLRDDGRPHQIQQLVRQGTVNEYADRPVLPTPYRVRNFDAPVLQRATPIRTQTEAPRDEPKKRVVYETPPAPKSKLTPPDATPLERLQQLGQQPLKGRVIGVNQGTRQLTVRLEAFDPAEVVGYLEYNRQTSYKGNGTEPVTVTVTQIRGIGSGGPLEVRLRAVKPPG